MSTAATYNHVTTGSSARMRDGRLAVLLQAQAEVRTQTRRHGASHGDRSGTAVQSVLVEVPVADAGRNHAVGDDHAVSSRAGLRLPEQAAVGGESVNRIAGGDIDDAVGDGGGAVDRAISSYRPLQSTGTRVECAEDACIVANVDDAGGRHRGSFDEITGGETPEQPAAARV